MLQHTQADAALVQAQLGRPARGRWSVARRCHLGIPMVVENHPVLEDGTPFPTLYWLTCPVLVKRLSRLESAGRMTELTEELERDRELKERFSGALARYRKRRDDHSPIDSAPPGGGPERVKCLHAHGAHELAAPPNPIGARALSETGWPDCMTACIEVPAE